MCNENINSLYLALDTRFGIFAYILWLITLKKCIYVFVGSSLKWLDTLRFTAPFNKLRDVFIRHWMISPKSTFSDYKCTWNDCCVMHINLLCYLLFSMFFIYRLLQDNIGYHIQSFHSYRLQFYAIIWYAILMICYKFPIQCYKICILCFEKWNEVLNDMV